MSEFTGSGKISEEESKIKDSILISISPVEILLFIVSEDLSITLPLIVITLS